MHVLHRVHARQVPRKQEQQVRHAQECERITNE